MEVTKWSYKWKSGYPDGKEYALKPIKEANEDLINEFEEGFELGVIPSTYTETTQTGALTTVMGFQYGTFEFDILLPKGNNLNPFIHLRGGINPNSVLKILDTPSGNGGRYGSRFFPFYTLEGGVECSSSKQNFTSRVFSNPMKKYLKVKLVWTPNSIQIYYNNGKVVSLGKDVAQDFNQSCQLILSLTTEKHELYCKDSTSFIVKDFKYTPHE